MNDVLKGCASQRENSCCNGIRTRRLLQRKDHEGARWKLSESQIEPAALSYGRMNGIPPSSRPRRSTGNSWVLSNRSSPTKQVMSPAKLSAGLMDARSETLLSSARKSSAVFPPTKAMTRYLPATSSKPAKCAMVRSAGGAARTRSTGAPKET